MDASAPCCSADSKRATRQCGASFLPVSISYALDLQQQHGLGCSIASCQAMTWHALTSRVAQARREAAALVVTVQPRDYAVVWHALTSRAAQARREAATLLVAVQATPVPDAPIVRSLAEGAAAVLRSAGAAGGLTHARSEGCAGLGKHSLSM